MSHRSHPRARVRFAIGFATAALLVAAGCSKQEAATPAATTTPTTSAATTTVAGAGATTTTAASSSASTTTTFVPKKSVGNSDVKKELSASSPELWALVYYDYMSWDAFEGFNIPLVAGADETKAVELCEAVSKVVYEGIPETDIVIAVGATADDIKGKPIVKRTDKSDTCKPV